LKKNSKIKLGSEIVNTFPSPGHTPGSVCFFIKKKKVLFSGDTLFKNGLGRTDFAYSSPRSLESSLKKIEKHFQGYQVYPGHGSTFLIQNCKI